MNYNKAELCKDCKMPVEKQRFRRGQKVSIPAPRRWWSHHPDYRNARVIGVIETVYLPTGPDSGKYRQDYEVKVMRPDLVPEHIQVRERDVRRA